jgi:hypothetical protein
MEIESMLKTGLPKTLIVKKYKITAVALWNWLKKRQLDKIEPEL